MNQFKNMRVNPNFINKNNNSYLKVNVIIFANKRKIKYSLSLKEIMEFI